MTNPNPLASSARNVTSQHGEDGIIEKIFSLIGTTDTWCVEFGAWDGKRYSNTHNLIANKGWHGVLIEANPERFQELNATYTDNAKAIRLNRLISFTGDDSLDAILSTTAISRNFDLLAVDIDGNDYHVWASLERFEPRVIVIEYNPTIQNDIEFIQPADMDVNQGSSLLAMTRLADRKGYELAAVTDSNAIFVRRDLYPKLGILDNSPAHMFPEKEKYEMRLFQLYDGTLVLRGCNRLLWKGMKIDPEKLQVLSSRERIFGDTVSYTTSLPLRATLVKTLRACKKLARLLVPKALLAWRAKRVNEKNDHRRWLANGRPVPPPHIVKQHIVAWYRNAFRDNTVLIETGTFRGDMVDAMRSTFKKIITIELSDELHRAAVERFSRFPHISVLRGDSAEILPQVLKDIHQPAIFWLDGHYTRGAVRGNSYTPISDEIVVVLRHDSAGHVILIDDARLFNGTDDYPKLSEFIAEIKRTAPNLHVQVLNDVIRITAQPVNPPF